MLKTECLDCELRPVVEFNGDKLCSRHAEQVSDFSARTAPPIAYTRHVPFKGLQGGASTSGSPRHYK